MIRGLTFFAALALAAPAFAQDAHGEHQAPPQQQTEPDSMQGMGHMDMGDMPMQHDTSMAHDAMDDMMHGVLGAYPATRDASGTSWQPDVSAHSGVHAMAGDWMLMGHALLNGVYDWQGGSRGDEKAFVSGMIMGMAQRDFGADTLQLRAMLAPDPFMGKAGYPLLLAQGETADGATPLVDRQHPHDLFMELAASYAHRLGEHDSLFVYAGLPGEPAFGPPAFMHRLSSMDTPEAPITHHWFDSTHITFGVVTAGWVHDNWKFEASRFRGREPDEHRYDIESGELDSTAARVSWNPTQNWALQVSWADIASPEQLEPDLDEERWSASAIYTRPIGEAGWWSTTGAFGRKQRSDGVDTDAWTLETAYHPDERWTFFARGERLETDELAAGPVETVGRLSIGAIRDWRLSEHAAFGVGASVEQTLIPSGLDTAYDGDPQGAMGFVRLKLG